MHGTRSGLDGRLVHQLWRSGRHSFPLAALYGDLKQKKARIAGPFSTSGFVLFSVGCVCELLLDILRPSGFLLVTHACHFRRSRFVNLIVSTLHMRHTLFHHLLRRVGRNWCIARSTHCSTGNCLHKCSLLLDYELGERPGISSGNDSITLGQLGNLLCGPNPGRPEKTTHEVGGVKTAHGSTKSVDRMRLWGTVSTRDGLGKVRYLGPGE